MSTLSFVLFLGPRILRAEFSFSLNTLVLADFYMFFIMNAIRL